MRSVKTFHLAILAALTCGIGQANAQTLSNRHHLSGCAVQSAPIVIPYADYRSVRLGLPVDVDGRSRVQEIYGYDEDSRLRLRRNGLSLRTHGGGAILSRQEETTCPAH